MKVKSKTISTIFFLPILKLDREKLQNYGFINAYAKDVDYDMDYVDCAFLLFKPPDMGKFNHFVEDEYERIRFIVDDYDYEGGYTVLVYKLDPVYREDYELIRQGKYSKTSIEFQNRFVKSKKTIIKGKIEEEPTLQHRIFTKSDKLRDYWEEKIGMGLKEDFEVWEGWDDETETLNIKDI